MAQVASDDYVGSVEEGYSGQYENVAGWVGISNGAELKKFILQKDTFKGQNGYLMNDIIDFNWDTEGAPYLAIKSETATGMFDKILDGCGYTITLAGQDYNNIGTPSGDEGNLTNPNALVLDKAFANEGESTSWIVYGGLASGLDEKAEIKNLRFKIATSHAWRESIALKTVVVGALVGYVSPTASVKNVQVEMMDSASNFGVNRRYQDGGLSWTNNQHTVINLGILAGVSEGTISLCQSMMTGGANLTAMGYAKRKSGAVGDHKKAYVRVGGMVGFAQGGEISNSKFTSRLTTGTIKTEVERDNAQCDSFLCSAFVVAINRNAEIKNVAIEGVLNGKLHHVYTGSGPKSASFVCEGTQATNKYAIATDGGESQYTENGSVTAMIKIETGGAIVNFDQTQLNRMLVIAPQGSVLWSTFGEDNTLSTATLQRVSVLFPQTQGLIEVGTSKKATAGFYNGDAKVSGNVPYKASEYEIKILLEGASTPVVASGISAKGDLKLASQNPVTLNVQEGIIYKDNQNKVLVTSDNLLGKEEKITINKAVLKINEIGFSGGKASIVGDNFVEITGLLLNDEATMNGEKVANGERRELLYAGTYTINVPSGNYCFENGSSNYTIIVSPLEINVEKGIEIQDQIVSRGILTLQEKIKSLNISANFDLYGLQFSNFVVDGGSQITNFKTSNTNISATISVTPTLKNIKLGAKELLDVQVTIDGTKKTVKFGDKVVATCGEKPNQVFKGWQIAGQFVSYTKEYTFRATKDVEIKSVYAPLLQSDIYTHIFLDWQGAEYRMIKNAVSDMSKNQEVVLQNELSWNFAGWKIDKKSGNTTTYKPIYVYDQSVGEKVQVTQNGVSEQTEFNKEILLEQGEYSINGAKVSVGAEGLKINAITDMVIEKTTTTQTKTASSKVVATQNEIIVAVTFVTDEQVNDVYLDMGIAKATVDNVVKKGNVYQFVAKIKKSNIQQVFGNQATINATIKVNGATIGSNIEIVCEV